MPLIHCHYSSEVLGLSCSMCVILPQAPTRQTSPVGTGAPSPRYKTLYLLHGLSDDHTIWQRQTSIERYVAPLGLAVVMPAGHRSYYTDMKRGWRYWTHISEEVPALARQFFPLSDRREDNFVAGLSMGGYGAFKLALRCPDRFAAAASLSGALHVVRWTQDAGHDATRRAEFENVFGTRNDLEGSDNDLFALATRLAAGDQPRPKLWQWCGTEDFLYQDNLAFRDHAQRLGLDLAYSQSPGGHDWACWDAQIQNVLLWLMTL